MLIASSRKRSPSSFMAFSLVILMATSTLFFHVPATMYCKRNTTYSYLLRALSYEVTDGTTVIKIIASELEHQLWHINTLYYSYIVACERYIFGQISNQYQKIQSFQQLKLALFHLFFGQWQTAYKVLYYKHTPHPPLAS